MRGLSDFSSTARNETEYFRALGDFLRQGGWKLESEASNPEKGADLVISRGVHRYVVVLKVSSEGRRDRLVALLSQAILQARAAARASNDDAVPLAVVAAPLIPQGAAEELMNFRAKFVPDAAVGIFDRDNFWRFVGPGLETLAATPKRSARKEKLRVPDSANLFSDLNRWLLKVLLAPLISEDLLHAPRGSYRNASELAKAAGVSVMSSFRFVRQLEQEGFLDDDSGALRLVRRQNLMSRWRAAHLRPVRELPLSWIDPVRDDLKLLSVLRAYNGDSPPRQRPQPRACLGLFTAAECLGFGPAQGVPPNFYLEYPDRAALVSMDVTPQGAEYRPDLFVRFPIFRESIFRAAVIRDNVLVADILQVWLDVSSPANRSEAQAEEIRQRALMPIFTETSK